MLFFGEADAPLPGELVINEIMFDPVNGSDGEYVELLNLSDKLFDLRTLVFTDDGDPDATTASKLAVTGGFRYAVGMIGRLVA